MFMNFGTTLCSQMYAPFLIDNSINMTSEKFNYTETNLDKDFKKLRLRFDKLGIF